MRLGSGLHVTHRTVSVSATRSIAFLQDRLQDSTASKWRSGRTLQVLATSSSHMALHGQTRSG